MFKIKESNITKNHEIPLHKLQAKYFVKALKKHLAVVMLLQKLPGKNHLLPI